ncbi:hypothetical protein G3I59_07525 [Amycolatopsis rubida]|uniref:Uncharacterized protein n=1 Tax=Amycolatopsis rubida TaxID=112413 RepID=A0ABX0BRJ4_9PSEU|nr:MULTISPECIES: hypothetical protein [Amycolatopsis]NEC55450.1 hypothetical protein [Amycolatopsis rubida]OAP21346.1 hypothetical protein A4R44_07864 [Amycolatopsis sp. M39]
MFLLCALPARLFGLVLALSASAVVVCVIRPGRPFREPELRTAASAGFLIVVLLISRTARFSGQHAALARSGPRSAGLPARQAPQRVLAVVVPLDRRVAPGLLDQLGHVLVAARVDEPLAVAGATDARGIGDERGLQLPGRDLLAAALDSARSRRFPSPLGETSSGSPVPS